MPSAPAARKPYFINKTASRKGAACLQMDEKEGDLERTPLFETHQKLGAKMAPLPAGNAGLVHPVVEEHTAVRKAAGLMSLTWVNYQAEGPDACLFLDSVCGNDITTLVVGESLYTHFLDQMRT